MEREKRFKWRICNERGNQNRRKGRNEECEMKANKEKGSWGRRLHGRGGLERQEGENRASRSPHWARYMRHITSHL